MTYPRELYEDHALLKKEWAVIERKFRERFGLLGALDDERAAAMLRWVVDTQRGQQAWAQAILEVDADEKRSKKGYAPPDEH